MKNRFIEYHIEEYINDILEKAIIVLDTNSLLNLYRYNNDNRVKYLDILEKLNERLYSTQQIMNEFYRNRNKLIRNRIDFKEKLTHYFNDAFNGLVNRIESGSDGELGSVLAILRFEDDLNYKIKKIVNESRDKISHEIESFINDIDNSYLMTSDKILDKICELYDNKIHAEFSQEKLDEVYKRGEDRYEKLIPPGYKDNNKQSPSKYGDLVIWYEMMDVAKIQKSHVLFISDDRKDDWVLNIDGKDYGTRRDLIKEFYNETGQLFYSMKTSIFIENISKIINITDIEELESETDRIANIIDYNDHINNNLATNHANNLVTLEDLKNKLNVINNNFDINDYFNNAINEHSLINYLESEKNRNDIKSLINNQGIELIAKTQKNLKDYISCNSDVANSSYLNQIFAAKNLDALINAQKSIRELLDFKKTLSDAGIILPDKSIEE